MIEFLKNSVFFGVFLTLVSYSIGILIQKKIKLAVFNPLLVAIVISVAVILVFDIDYQKYSESTQILSYLMTPATICLAIPLYEKMAVLKENYKAIFIGISSGVLTSLCSILLFAVTFGFDHNTFVLEDPDGVDQSESFFQRTAVAVDKQNDLTHVM